MKKKTGFVQLFSDLVLARIGTHAEKAKTMLLKLAYEGWLDATVWPQCSIARNGVRSGPLPGVVHRHCRIFSP